MTDEWVCTCDECNSMINEWPGKSEKSPDLQVALSAFAGVEGNIFGDRADCATCDKAGLKPTDFNDELSRKEFGISRMCQECQDKVFE